METLWRPGGAGGAPRRFHHKILWVTYRSAPLPPPFSVEIFRPESFDSIARAREF